MLTIQEKYGAFSVIVQPVVEPIDRFAALTVILTWPPAGGHLHPLRLQGAEPRPLRGLRPPEHRAALQPGRVRWVHTVLQCL